jgi:SH3 domain-containing YSC84-like protein 1
MDTKTYTRYFAIVICALALVATQSNADDYGTKTKETGTATKSGSTEPDKNGKAKGKAHAQNDQIVEAANVVKKMASDAELSSVLGQARGVLIIPNFKQAALGVGVSGGGGVLVVRHNGNWSSPAFYNVGGVSAGLSAGVETGSIVMVLNTQKAVEEFMQNDNWSLDANAGLTVINWDGKAQATTGKDVVLWSDTDGLFASAALEVKDVSYDDNDNAKYYGKKVAFRDVLEGKVNNPQAAVLKDALPDISG